MSHEENQKRVRHGNPIFYALLADAAEIHDRKSHDYASNDNPCGNYHFAGELASLFAHSPKDMGFVGRIGEKLYRLANLEKDGKIPKNESVEDTEIDIITIATLWIADRRQRRIMDGTANTNAKDTEAGMIRQSQGLSQSCSQKESLPLNLRYPV